MKSVRLIFAKCSRENICLVIKFLKCLATSCVGSVINVKIDVILQDIIPKCLGYLLRLQKMQYTLFMYSLTYVSSRRICGWRADRQVDGNID